MSAGTPHPMRARLGQHAFLHVLTWGGADFEARVWYDVLSTPHPGTLIDPPDYLVVDVTAVELLAVSTSATREPLPAGIQLDPAELPDDLEEAAADDWHENHSPGALRAQAEDYREE